MSDQIRVNGNQHSWGSLILKLRNGSRFTGLTDIEFSDKREREYAHSMSPSQSPRGRSRGKYTPDPCKIAGYVGSIDDLLEEIAALAPDGVTFGDVEFDVLVQYVDTGERPKTVLLKDCTIVAVKESHSDGSENLKTELELQCMLIIRNGLTLSSSNA